MCRQICGFSCNTSPALAQLRPTYRFVMRDTSFPSSRLLLRGPEKSRKRKPRRETRHGRESHESNGQEVVENYKVVTQTARVCRTSRNARQLILSSRGDPRQTGQRNGPSKDERRSSKKVERVLCESYTSSLSSLLYFRCLYALRPVPLCKILSRIYYLGMTHGYITLA